MSSVNIGVLISGGGSNLQAVIDDINAGVINGKIQVVISNKKDAYGLVRAKNHGIDAIYVDKRKFENNNDFNREIIKILEEKNVDLVILAGYLKILSEEFVKKYQSRIINIHPSLIPSFCGMGYYGRKVHEKVLEYGVKITGATVHFVDEGADTGSIILQEAVIVDDNETVDTLQKKVLEIEHKILPKAVQLYCDDKLEIKGRKVHVRN